MKARYVIAAQSRTSQSTQINQSWTSFTPRAAQLIKKNTLYIYMHLANARHNNNSNSNNDNFVRQRQILAKIYVAINAITVPQRNVKK